MREQLTRKDVEKIEKEIEYRKLVVRSRIRYLERMLKTARIVKDDAADDEVGLDKKVEVYFEDDDETEVFKLVTSVRGSSLNGKISIESPIGRAIMKHRAGDRVYVKVNDNAGYYVVIRSVDKTDGEDEDAIRKY